MDNVRSASEDLQGLAAKHEKPEGEVKKDICGRWSILSIRMALGVAAFFVVLGLMAYCGYCMASGRGMW
jgi:hypothetical protein